MQQLCLTGDHAGIIVGRLFDALNLRPVGLRILPFAVDGAPAGEALHLLPPPPGSSCVPCRIRLTKERSVIVPQALAEVGAPGILSALRIQSPVLLEGLHGDLLTCEPFLDAVCQCMLSHRPVVLTADASAAAILRQRLPEERQIWFDVPDDPAGQAALLNTLLPEASLRL